MSTSRPARASGLVLGLFVAACGSSAHPSTSDGGRTGAVGPADDASARPDARAGGGADASVSQWDGGLPPTTDAGGVIRDGSSESGSPIDAAAGTDAGPADSGSSTSQDAGVGPVGGPITCAAPGTYTKNGGACGTERWNIKTGTDPYTASVSLVPKQTTIATLAALAAAGGGTSRESPTETTLWELRDVTLSMIKLETDSDYHIVLSDGAATMIVEIPYPDCASGSPWSCFISRSRSEVDGKYTVGSPQYPAATVTVRGVGFFDYQHGQTGVAPNAIELHPVLQICFGQGCTPT